MIQCVLEISGASLRIRDQVKPLLAASLICSLVLSISQAPILINALELASNKLVEQQKQQQHQHSPLKAELDSIMQQRDSFDPSDRSLAEAIITRLMMDDLSDELLAAPTESESDSELLGGTMSKVRPEAGGETAEQQLSSGRSYPIPTGPEALRLKKLLSMIQAYETMLSNGWAANQVGFGSTSLPMLPGGQAATSKRASKLVGNYLQQRQLVGNGNSNPNGYGRSSFDFGLGKRPDTTGASSNILRFGDSLTGGGGSVQGVNQFGKRPSAHRYDFGLGKRVASSAYPRYDFGLGKRAPNSIRYDFGLGK